MADPKSISEKGAASRARNRRWRENNRARKNEQSNHWYAKQRAARCAAKALAPIPTTKRCARCALDKPFAEFGVDRTRKGGHNVYCKPCARALRLAWDAANREKKRASIRKYYRSHREQVLAKGEALRQQRKADNPEKVRADHRRWKKQWRLNNPQRARARDHVMRARHLEKAKACVRRWNAANPDKKRDHAKCWAEANPAKYQEMRRALSLERRVRKYNAFVERVDPMVVYVRDRGVCGICANPIVDQQKWHIDHVIPLSRGGKHAYSNVQLAHARCNMSKGARVSAA